jgi:hypothetical protein
MWAPLCHSLTARGVAFILRSHNKSMTHTHSRVSLYIYVYLPSYYRLRLPPPFLLRSSPARLTHTFSLSSTIRPPPLTVPPPPPHNRSPPHLPLISPPVWSVIVVLNLARHMSRTALSRSRPKPHKTMFIIIVDAGVGSFGTFFCYNPQSDEGIPITDCLYRDPPLASAVR